MGVNGGGLNHYVGQEKLAPMDSWSAIAFAKDWQAAIRLQQTPIWHYINTCQYRYDGQFSRYNTVPDNELTRPHMADQIYKSVRMGWMPFYPQFDQNTLELCKEARDNGQVARSQDLVAAALEKTKTPVSIDTSKAAVAREAIAAGAEIINDVTALVGDPTMIDVARDSGAGVCAMHMQGTPQTMQDDPKYDDVVEDVFESVECLACAWHRHRHCSPARRRSSPDRRLNRRRRRKYSALFDTGFGGR